MAEILPDGGIKILRMVNTLDERSIDFTIIQASEFNLICGACQNIVIYKKPYITSPQVNILMSWGTMVQYYEKQ